MPLYKIINFNTSTQILVWKISESFEQLLNEVELNEKSLNRLNGMKSQIHQRGFLSVRKLLQEVGYTDFDLFYDEFGKPHLKGEKHISITHSHGFSAIILSNKTVGIDIEIRREKIKIIADKFVDQEFNYLNKSNSDDYISKLTIIWGVKESVFKIRNEPGISFKDHIMVRKFEINDKQSIAKLHFMNFKKEFKIYFEELEDYTLVYAFEN
ncbi:MAG TPA: 4'-phosphopantetheinyl transferase superfamily protein [Flavobacterium sp.]|nr:4'-phosphopantetheinyl transferase superfamily protein [Flavobacterium sp.]